MSWFRKAFGCDKQDEASARKLVQAGVNAQDGSVLVKKEPRVNTKDDSLLVWIPPGEFEMGDDGMEWQPKHRVYLDGYWMGAYCVTNRQYEQFVADTGWKVQGRWQKMAPQRSGRGDHPAVYLCWNDCVAYAEWAGLALPTEAQWEKACGGQEGFKWPWGNVWDPTRCRHRDNAGDPATAVVGAYPTGVSGYGTYQQSGNVREWCADWYDENYYTHSSASKNPKGPRSGTERVLRGGSFMSPPDKGGDFTAAGRRSGDPKECSTGYGFRLAGN